MQISIPENDEDINNVYNNPEERAFNDLKKQYPTIPWTDNLFDDLWGKLSQRFTPNTKRYLRQCFFDNYTKQLHSNSA